MQQRKRMLFVDDEQSVLDGLRSADAVPALIGLGVSARQRRRDA